jgi:hypothetical protein
MAPQQHKHKATTATVIRRSARCAKKKKEQEIATKKSKSGTCVRQFA